MTKATAQAAVRHTSLISLVRLHPPEAAEGGGNKSYLKAPRFPQRVEPVEYSVHNGQPEQEKQEKQPAPPNTGRAARSAGHKLSAVKSKAVSSYHLLQSITEHLTSIPEQEAPSTGSGKPYGGYPR